MKVTAYCYDKDGKMYKKIDTQTFTKNRRYWVLYNGYFRPLSYGIT